MEIIRGLRNLSYIFRRPVLTIGNFDGVHIGHRAILEEVRLRANAIEGQAIVLTFEPHPLKALKPEICPPIITNLDQKAEIISSFNIDVLVAAEFTPEFGSLSPRDFIVKILQKKIGAREIIVGHDYGFGRGRQGTIESLTEMGKEFNFVVDVVDPVSVDGRIVSSTLIRQTVMNGDVDYAGRLLGRPYAISGKVIEGLRRGQKLGFPTANLLSKNELFPKRGVYVVFATVANQTYGAVANIGYNPTFGDVKFSVEVHILDFDQDIYGEEIAVSFITRLRDEVKFSGVDQLVAQINKDVAKAREIFASDCQMELEKINKK
jgi:riboflavin kinase/FMN adenylyltransferase